MEFSDLVVVDYKGPGMHTYGPLRLAVFVEPMFEENAFLLWTETAPDCWIVDPGFPPQAQQIIAEVRERKLTPSAILVTHCHPDHIAGVHELRVALDGVPFFAPRDEAKLLRDPVENLSAMMGLSVTAPEADRWLAPADELTLGTLKWRVLDVAGHSPGGLAFQCPDVGVVLTGDALFAGSIGRFDFPHSSRERLLENIQQNLLTLPAETVLWSGHGPASTIGHEQQHNAVLREELGL